MVLGARPADVLRLAGPHSALHRMSRKSTVPVWV